MKFVNLTPHPIRMRVATDDTRAQPREDDIVVQSSGSCRIAANPGEKAGEADGVPLYGRTQYGEVVGLPPAADDTIHIVSVMLVGRVPDRDDCFVPGTGPKDGCIRTLDGNVYAATRLVQA